MQDAVLPPATSNARLHNAGMRSTLPRRAVLETIMATPDHRSADEVRRALEERGIDLPRSSINNILGAFAGAGLINRVETLPGPARFERDTSDHDHFWCVRCRRASNVPAPRIKPPPVAGRVLVTAITYQGECETCGGAHGSHTQRKDRHR
jgi:Fe2+ or Zn2+ uptake regulation protein